MNWNVHSQSFQRACATAAAGAVAAAAVVLAALAGALLANAHQSTLVVVAAVLSGCLLFPVLLILKLRGIEIAGLTRRLNDLSSRDPTTNALNATTFAKAVGRYAERRKRIATDNGGVMISALVTSFDDLSRRYGPEWAETVMKSLTVIVQSSVRSGDLVARLSMNELGIFLPGAAAENALDVAQRIRSRVAASASATDGTNLPVSLKLGGTFFDGLAQFNTVRQLASEAAYDAADDEPIVISQSK